MKSVSVVINARLGSTRVKDKLVRPFAHKSLIEIALEKLDVMDFFEHRYLAVAEDKLRVIGSKYKNIEVLNRSIDAVKPGVNDQKITFAHYLNVPSDYIFVFNPCLPMITVDTIKKAYEYFQETDYISYTSSIPTRDWVFDHNGNALTNSDPRNLTTNKGEVFYKVAHAFHIINKENLKNTGHHWTFSVNDPHLIEIPERESIDVDEILDFEFAEFAYKNKKT